MTEWTKIRSCDDFPKEGEIVVGKYVGALTGKLIYLILRYHTDEGKSYWENADTEDDEGEPDFWKPVEENKTP